MAARLWLWVLPLVGVVVALRYPAVGWWILLVGVAFLVLRFLWAVHAGYRGRGRSD
jgi:hypothetical protein